MDTELIKTYAPIIIVSLLCIGIIVYFITSTQNSYESEIDELHKKYDKLTKNILNNYDNMVSNYKIAIGTLNTDAVKVLKNKLKEQQNTFEHMNTEIKKLESAKNSIESTMTKKNLEFDTILQGKLKAINTAIESIELNKKKISDEYEAKFNTIKTDFTNVENSLNRSKLNAETQLNNLREFIESNKKSYTDMINAIKSRYNILLNDVEQSKITNNSKINELNKLTIKLENNILNINAKHNALVTKINDQIINTINTYSIKLKNTKGSKAYASFLDLNGKIISRVSADIDYLLIELSNVMMKGKSGYSKEGDNVMLYLGELDNYIKGQWGEGITLATTNNIIMKLNNEDKIKLLKDKIIINNLKLETNDNKFNLSTKDDTWNNDSVLGINLGPDINNNINISGKNGMSISNAIAINMFVNKIKSLSLSSWGAISENIQANNDILGNYFYAKNNLKVGKRTDGSYHIELNNTGKILAENIEARNDIIGNYVYAKKDIFLGKHTFNYQADHINLNTKLKTKDLVTNGITGNTILANTFIKVGKSDKNGTFEIEAANGVLTVNELKARGNITAGNDISAKNIYGTNLLAKSKVEAEMLKARGNISAGNDIVGNYVYAKNLNARSQVNTNVLNATGNINVGNHVDAGYLYSRNHITAQNGIKNIGLKGCSTRKDNTGTDKCVGWQTSSEGIVKGGGNLKNWSWCPSGKYVCGMEVNSDGEVGGMDCCSFSK